jgi:hypothetical protein
MLFSTHACRPPPHSRLQSPAAQKCSRSSLSRTCTALVAGVLPVAAYTQGHFVLLQTFATLVVVLIGRCVGVSVCARMYIHSLMHTYIHSHTCVLMAKQPKSTQSSQSVLLNSLIALAAQISTLVAVPFLSSYAFLLLDGQVCVCVCVYVCVALIPHRYHVHVTPDTHTHTLYIYIHISRTA